LALISEKHEDYEESLDYYKRFFQKFEELGDQKRADTVQNLMAHNLLELGNKYADFKVLKRAERYYKDSLELYQITEDVHGQGQALKGMGAVSENYGNQEKALDYYKKALDRFREAGDHRETKLVSDLMAKIWES